MNDLPESCPKLNCIMYADDTTLYSSSENFDSNNIEREINYELEKVNLWLKANKLSLNVKKTKCMFFHKRKTLPHINLSINDVVTTTPRYNQDPLFTHRKRGKPDKKINENNNF